MGMQYILVDERRKQDAMDYVTKLDGSVVFEVVIRPYKKNRSRSQNNTMWMWYEDLSEHTGYTPEELHEVLKAEFLGYDVFLYKGCYCIKPKSTTELTTKAMAVFLNKIEVLAKWLEVRLRYPDEYNYAMYLKN
jgi:hypothetical protein